MIKGAYGGSALHDASAGIDGFTVTKRSTSTTRLQPASLALREAATCTPPSPTPTRATRPRPTGSVTFTLPELGARRVGDLPRATTCTLAPAAPTPDLLRHLHARDERGQPRSTPPTAARSCATRTPTGLDHRHQALDLDHGDLPRPRSHCTRRVPAAPPSPTPTRATRPRPTGSVTFTLDPSSVAGATGTSPAAPAARSPRQAPTARAARSATARRPPRAAHVIKGAYGGSALHDTSAGSDSITVTKRSTSTTIACPASLALHRTGSCHAAVSDTDAGDKAAPPGSVTLTLNPSSVAGATGTSPAAPACAGFAPGRPRQRELLGQLPPGDHRGQPRDQGRLRRQRSARHERRQRLDHRHQALDLDHDRLPGLARTARDGFLQRHRLRHRRGRQGRARRLGHLHARPELGGRRDRDLPGGASCTLAPAGPDSASSRSATARRPPRAAT